MLIRLYIIWVKSAPVALQYSLIVLFLVFKKDLFIEHLKIL